MSGYNTDLNYLHCFVLDKSGSIASGVSYFVDFVCHSFGAFDSYSRIMLKNHIFLLCYSCTCFFRSNLTFRVVVAYDFLVCYNFVCDINTFILLLHLGGSVLFNICHYLKSFRIQSCPGPYFPVFELSTERYGVSLRIQSECRKMRVRITQNTDTFHAVCGPIIRILSSCLT